MKRFFLVRFIYFVICVLFIFFFYHLNVSAIGGIDDKFNSTWNTSAVSDGSSNSTSISLPLESDGTYDFVVSWGDGNSGTVTSWDDVDRNHTYASEGVYNVSISGTIEGFRFNNEGDRLKIVDISQWGDLRLIDRYDNSYFRGCSNLDSSATDVLNLSGITNLQSMFRDCSSFNGNLSSWNMSEVTNINYMFLGASSFNQHLSNWDVSSVTSMRGTFNSASNFNGNISNWNVSKVTDMSYMFLGASSFNHDLSSWDVSGVTNMGYLFSDASSFNQNLSNWDVSSVTSMNSMFSGASSFNHDLNNWNVSSVTQMGRMFLGASSFNQNLSSWNVSKVTDMNNMFSDADFFNGNISSWDVSSVADMNNMFHNAVNFTGDLSSWDVSSVVNMERMFYYTNFNGDISSWDVSNVGNMRQMFAYMSSFNQDLGSWNVSNVTDMTDMFNGVTLSVSNYDSLLNGWASLSSLQNDVSFSAGNSQYCLGESARNDTLIGVYNWSVSDGGFNSTYDAFPPTVTIHSPLSKSYLTTDFPLILNISLSENGSVWYTLNGGVNNFSMTGNESENYGTQFNASIESLTAGNYIIYIYANDTSGNLNSTQNISLTITVPVNENLGSTVTASVPSIQIGEVNSTEFSGELRYGYRGDFKVNNKRHRIYLRGINRENKTAKFDIYSSKKSVEVKVGEIKKVDLDNDGVEDIELLVNSIDDNRVAVNLDLKVVDGEVEEVEIIEDAKEENKTEKAEEIIEEVKTNYFWKVFFIVLLIVLGIVYWKRNFILEKMKKY